MPIALGGAADGTVSGSLAPALAISIALHAALLAGLPDLWTTFEPPAPPPLMAWLAPGAPLAHPPDAAPGEAPERPPAAAARPRSIATPQAAPPPPATSDPERDAAAEIHAPRVSAPSAGEPGSVAAASPAGAAPETDSLSPPAGESPARAAERGEAVPDLGTLAQYRLALIGAAKQQKRYPPRAIDLGWEGRVDVRLVVGVDGALAELLVQRSSGHDLLDRQALELMRKAAALTPVPPALANREFAVEVPVLYELKEAR
jgi:protein TonB